MTESIRLSSASYVSLAAGIDSGVALAGDASATDVDVEASTLLPVAGK
jgi:hypothetical protein